MPPRKKAWEPGKKGYTPAVDVKKASERLAAGKNPKPVSETGLPATRKAYIEERLAELFKRQSESLRTTKRVDSRLQMAIDRLLAEQRRMHSNYETPRREFKPGQNFNPELAEELEAREAYLHERVTSLERGHEPEALKEAAKLRERLKETRKNLVAEHSKKGRLKG